jgi:hypothetical protein
MKNYTFGFEVQTLLEQFVGAFNDVIIKRYDHENTIVAPTSGFKVLYVYSPKQRVFNTLNNPAPGGMTVPVIAVSIGGISRDQTRVFNKIDGFNIPFNGTSDGVLEKKILQPVPVNITVNMSIVTRYQMDMDQILTNFIPYCDPYIIISWKLPDGDGDPKTHLQNEIRTEVLWNGNINLQYPDNLAPTSPFRITADTSFLIKGWLFKNSTETVKRIYTIKSDYYAEDLTSPTTDSILQSYESLFGNTTTI